MRDETKQWILFAEENLKSAKILHANHLFNPCLQNIQQSVEKALKSILIEKSLQLRRTHSISELRNILLAQAVDLDLSEEDCEFLDSIYLPSKYPLGAALPGFAPDENICQTGIAIAEKIYFNVKTLLLK